MWHKYWLYLGIIAVGTKSNIFTNAAGSQNDVEDVNESSDSDNDNADTGIGWFDNLFDDFLADLDYELGFSSKNETILNLTLDSFYRSNENGESRKKKGDKMTKIMPMFMIPFLLQSAMVPMMLASMKFMLVKSLLIGKLALILIGLNALRRSTIHDAQKRLAVEHYGYKKGSAEEIGAWFNY